MQTLVMQHINISGYHILMMCITELKRISQMQSNIKEMILNKWLYITNNYSPIINQVLILIKITL